jgi:glycosyltransferase involved in cell wall biosynthesis
VSNFLSRATGTRAVCEDLAEHLSREKWLVITTSNKTGRLERLCDMVCTIWRNQRNFEVAQVDVFSGLSFLWAEVVCLILRVIRKPYLLTLHGGNLPSFARRWPGRVKRLLRGAVAVTTPSRYLQTALGNWHQDVHYLPNALNIKKYPFRLRAAPTPRLCWLRRFHQIYNPSLAVKMLALLVLDFPELQLDFIGPDSGDGSLEEVLRLATELGVEKNLRIIGGVPKQDIPRQLSNSDLFINTTDYESFGVSVMEAAASGLCIVTTSVGELSYLWRQEHDALLVPPNDPAAMAMAVRRILTEPDLAARLSRHARQKAEQFDWSVIMPRWELLLSEVANGFAKH